MVHEKVPLVHSKDTPFTGTEKVKAYVLVVMIPWLVWAPMLMFGAWLRTFPSLPRAWFGFWLTELTLTVAYLLGMTLLIDHPRILRERLSKFRPDKKTSDESEKRFFAIGGPIGLCGLFFVTWDASGQQEFPRLWNFVGSFMFFGSLMAIAVVFRENPYASKIVYKQDDQRLITSGPYRIVRHPMYLAMVFFLIGFPLCVGSFWGIVPMTLMVVLIAVRTYHEEEFLVHNFPEYRTYRKEVKYRIIPFLF